MNIVFMYRDPEGLLLPRCSPFQLMLATRDAYARNPDPRESDFEVTQWRRHMAWIVRSDAWLPNVAGIVSDDYRGTLLPQTTIPLHENDPWEFVR